MKTHHLYVKAGQRRGDHDDVLHFLFTHGRTRYGSAGNAAMILLRQSPEFKRWHRRAPKVEVGR